MIKIRILLKIATLFLAISTATAQKPADASLFDHVKRLVSPKKVENLQDVVNQAKKLTITNFVVALCAFYYAADRLKLGTHRLSKNLKILAPLSLGVGLVGYGHRLIGFYLYHYQLKDNENFKLPAAIEQHIREIILQRVPESRSFLSTTAFINNENASAHNVYAAAYKLRVFNTELSILNLIGCSPEMIEAIQSSVYNNNAIAVREIYALCHEAGHLIQDQADKELHKAIRGGWLPFLSDEHNKKEVAADVFAINRLTSFELSIKDVTSRNGENHCNGYLTNDQLNFIKQKRLESLQNQ